MTGTMLLFASLTSVNLCLRAIMAEMIDFVANKSNAILFNLIPLKLIIFFDASYDFSIISVMFVVSIV